MTKESRTFSIESDVSEYINQQSKKSRRNKSETAESLIRQSMGKKSDELEYLIQIKLELESLKGIIQKIYRVDE